MERKLIYIANIRLPTEKAHGVQIMEMCSAFTSDNIEVELIVPNRENSITDNPFSYHDISRVFSIRKLSSISLLNFGKLGYTILLFSFTFSVVCYSLFKKNTIFYTRDELIAFCLSIIGKSVVWESHTGQKNYIVRSLIYFGVPVVVITEALKRLYVSIGANASNVFVAPDGVDVERFGILISQDEARKRIGLPIGGIVILYTGHLYAWKGADTLAQTAVYLPELVRLVFVGGTDKHIADFRSRYDNHGIIHIIGNRPHYEIPLYLKSADILILPNSDKEEISRSYTSPMKLFEYMASGVPIIASDLPSLREIVDESLVSFFTPDDPNSLAKVIMHTLDNYEIAKEKGKKTLELAENYSWHKRAKDILDFITKIDLHRHF